MKIFLSLLLVMLAIAGIVDASYITYQVSSGQIPPCSVEFQCEKVLTSEYANIGPVPLSGLGLIYYLTILSLAIAHYLELNLKKLPLLNKLPYPVRPIDLLLIVSTFGFFFSLYLVFLMGVIIQGWCSYCLVSAAISTLIFLTTLLYNSLFSKHSNFLIKDAIYRVSHWKYQAILKPLLFRVSPDMIHHQALQLGSDVGSWGFFRWLTRLFFQFRHPSLESKQAGIHFPNPVGLPAGYDYNGDLTSVIPELGFGWHTIGTVTLNSYQGNTPPHYTRLPKSRGVIVNKGLKNLGAQAIANTLAGKHFQIPTGISIGSTNQQYHSMKEQILDIMQSFIIFEKSAVRHHYYELNISCPNVFGGDPFTTPERLEPLLAALDRLFLSRPVFIKMPIDLSESETKVLLHIITKHELGGVIFGNLSKDKNNPAIEPAERKIWEKQSGNVSGRATFERSNTLIALARKVLPKEMIVIGTGGIFSAADAQKKVDSGATLVQLITGMIFEGPQLPGQINLQLAQKTQSKDSIKDPT